jgi:hypothetical protein
MTFGNVEQNFDEKGIRAEEREKVLDELDFFCDEQLKDINPGGSGILRVLTFRLVKAKIVELRQQQGKG